MNKQISVTKTTIFLNGKEILKNLKKVLKSTKWKVRLAGVKAMKNIIVKEECQILFEDILSDISLLSQDKNHVKNIIKYLN